MLTPTALKLAAAVARWAVRIVLALLLLAAVAWGVLHWAIVPRIDQFRPALERLATRRVDAPVTIGAIRAQSNGLAPVIELSNVAVHDTQGRAALTIARAQVAFSIASLLRGGVEQLVIEQPVLDIRRTAQQRILVGGLDISGDALGDTGAADWFFSQPEFVVQGGTVRWIDDTRPAAPPVTLADLRLVIRNGALRHQWRLDATPDRAWGAPFTLSGEFRQPLLSRHPGRWRDWDGQAYALLPRADISRLRQYVNLRADWGVEISQGQGALRLWLDARHGELTGVTADLALGAVTATLGPGLEPLALASLSGRVGWRKQDGRQEITTRDLRFADSDGLIWPGGNFQLGFEGGGAGDGKGHGVVPESGTLQADKLDLGVLAKIASRLPLPPRVHQQLALHPVTGMVETLHARWSGPMDAPTDWQVNARASGLTIGAVDAADMADATGADGATAADAHHAGLPGIEGARLSAQATPRGGQIDLTIQNGALTFPGVFAEPRIPLQTLTARAQWKVDAASGQISVDVPEAAFANADATGTLRAHWHTGASTGASTRPPANPPTGAPPGDARFPGVLDLRALITRADGARVWRYLPQHIPQSARDYVRDAVQRGQVRDLNVRVQGDLRDVPFEHNPAAGQFRFDGQVSGVTLAYVPRRIQHPDEPPWPALEGLSGELIFDHASMQVKAARASAQNAPDWQFTRIDAGIADLEHPRVTVSADARGPLAAALAIVRDSPIAHLVHGALDEARASGDAALHLTLDLPIHDLEHAAQVTGRVTLADDAVRFIPEAPEVTQARGEVTFDQHGFALQDITGQALGGPVRISGGGQPGQAGAPPTVVRIAGTASSEGLRTMTDWGALAAIARHASGQAAYQAELDFRGERPALTVTSDLRGLAFDLPEPLAKPADARWPLRYEDHPLDATRDALRVTVAERLSVQLERTRQGQPLRGAYAMGNAADITNAPAALPASGISARVELPRLDAAAWAAAVADLSAPTPPPASPASPASTPSAPTAARPPEAAATATSPASVQDFLPTTWNLRVDELVSGERGLHAVTASGTRVGTLWRAQVQARELAGQIQYQPAANGQPGALHARLSRLVIPANEVRAATGDTAAASDAAEDSGEPPRHIPALDVEADTLEIAGKNLGKLTIRATNGKRPAAETEADDDDPDPDSRPDPDTNEWRLDQLTLETPEATLNATGRWAGRRHARQAGATRRTALRFTLELRDAGALLTRLGMPGVVRHGAGQLTGRAAWHGAPYALDTATLNGQLHLDIGKGQFLKADPGIAKLLGVLSLQALPRRLTLDFRDVFSAGFAFDFVRGDAQIRDGLVSSNNLQMKGADAAVLMDGSASLVAETQDLHVIVVPHIDAGTAALAATVINPAIGIGAFVAQWLLQKPLAQAATREFHIGGSWANPQVTQIKHPTDAQAKAAAEAAWGDASAPSPAPETASAPPPEQP